VIEQLRIVLLIKRIHQLVFRILFISFINVGIVISIPSNVIIL